MRNEEGNTAQIYLAYHCTLPPSEMQHVLCTVQALACTLMYNQYGDAVLHQMECSSELTICLSMKC